MFPRKCLDCKDNWGNTVFLWLTEDLWEKIGCKPDDYLCANCIMKRIKTHYSYGYFVVGDGKHVLNYVGKDIKVTDNRNK